MYRLTSTIGIMGTLLVTLLAGCAQEPALDDPAAAADEAQPATIADKQVADEAPTEQVGEASDSLISPFSATGGWIGSLVAVKIHVVGSGLHVNEVWADERWNSDVADGYQYGHTELYNTSTGLILNNSNHYVSSDGPNDDGPDAYPNKNYPNGSKMCARWWRVVTGGYVQYGSSCVNIHS
jgi:hypothetical protein